MDGICTLANDKVYNQLVALLNSIEAILGTEIPVCVYPYDDNTTQVAAEISRRPNVHLYNNNDSIQRWDKFAKRVWDTHPTALQRWSQLGNPSYYRFGTHRRYCAFDGIFDRFLYMDADTLLLGQVAPLFVQLEECDCVVYDFQYTDPTHVYNCSSTKLTELFTLERLQSEIFCSGFYASKKGLFDEERKNWLISKLKEGEAEVLYPMAPDQTLLNYMIMRYNLSIYNFALHLPTDEKTGCCVTSLHFQEQNHVLYDKGKQLTYLHYIGIKSQLFNRVCAGENIDFPYRDLFFHYRYLHEPEKRPKFTTKLVPYKQTPTLLTKALGKLGFTR